MIVLNLSCEREHLFEGWFASASAFESQCAAGQVSCPVCGSMAITRRPTAPYVNTRGASGTVKPRRDDSTGKSQNPDAVAMAMAMLRKLGRESEDVGERFAAEARRIHHGEADSRNIRGRASRDEFGELVEEGIMVLPLPSDEDVH